MPRNEAIAVNLLERRMSLVFRQYVASDRASCVQIFESNVPQFFHPQELEDFERYLNSPAGPYFVLSCDAQMIGCGGFAIRESAATADLCWGMVHSKFHGRGWGEYLLLGRLNALIENTAAQAVRLGTSQHVEGFFRRYGFAVRSVWQDGLALGLHDVEMRLELTDATRHALRSQWRRKVRNDS